MENRSSRCFSPAAARQAVRMLLAGLVLASATAHGQVVDPGFTPSFDDDVDAVAVYPGNRLLVAGSFNSVNGAPRDGVARLLPDGSLDTGFNPPVPSDVVRALGVQLDGRIVIGGEFQTLSGITRRYVARLNADGSLDDAFQPDIASGVIARVNRLAVQSDGKVLIAGRFSQIDGEPRQFIARLLDNGMLDAGFQDPQLDGDVEVIVPQADGKILLGGQFDEVFGEERRHLVRLQANGALDGAFADPDVGGSVLTMTVVADGRIIVGGTFGDVGAVSRPYVARINANGTVDASFGDAGIRFGGAVRQVRSQLDGRVLVAGDWRWGSTGTGGARVARLLSSGPQDPGFNEVLLDSLPYGLTVAAGGRAFAGGLFTLAGGLPRNRVVAIAPTDAVIDALEFSNNTVLWRRSGAVPDLAAPPRLEYSTDGSTFVVHSLMSPTADGWSVSGFSPPGNPETVHLRARAQVNGHAGVTEVLLRPNLVYRNGFEGN